jgi:hypothetical protein
MLPKWVDADEEASRLRFTMELEFVQCLSDVKLRPTMRAAYVPSRSWQIWRKRAF